MSRNAFYVKLDFFLRKKNSNINKRTGVIFVSRFFKELRHLEITTNSEQVLGIGMFPGSEPSHDIRKWKGGLTQDLSRQHRIPTLPGQLPTPVLTFIKYFLRLLVNEYLFPSLKTRNMSEGDMKGKGNLFIRYPCSHCYLISNSHSIKERIRRISMLRHTP